MFAEMRRLRLPGSAGVGVCLRLPEPTGRKVTTRQPAGHPWLLGRVRRETKCAMAFECGFFQKLRAVRHPSEVLQLLQQQRPLVTDNQPRRREEAGEELERKEFRGDRCLAKLEAAAAGRPHPPTSPDWSHFEGIFASELLGKEGEARTAAFLMEVVHVLVSHMLKSRDPGTKVLDFHHPEQLREMMGHCLDIHCQPRDLEQLLSDCKETLKYCVKTGHPRFMNQLSTTIDTVGVAAEWLTAAASCNMFTYEVAPVFTLMEDYVLSKMRSLVGWHHGDGIFAPGGAISNFYGVLLARQRACPEAKTAGMYNMAPPVIFTSEQSHFSLRRSAALLGIGSDNVVSIKCDARGRMCVVDLEEAMLRVRREGRMPLLVNATCGTTVLGSFDPLEDIADICLRHGVWLHVDGAWGGSVLLSRDHRHLMRGVERPDSLTWNPHKMMGVPLQCSCILTRHKGLLAAANEMQAPYLFQRDKHYDVSYDTGDKAVQCGRHNDIFKLWLMWRAKGDLGYEEQINRFFELAIYLRDAVKERPRFELVVEEIEGPNVCFWYLPQQWHHLSVSSIPPAQLNQVAPLLKARMMESGSCLVQYQPLARLPNFFRVAISNPNVTRKDLDTLLDDLDRLGHDIMVPQPALA